MITNKSRTQIYEFFFGPVGPQTLGFARCFFYFFVFSFFWNKTLWGVYAEEMAAFWRPVFLFDIFNVGPPSTTLLRLLVPIWKASLFLSMIGLFTNFASIMSATLGFFILGVGNSFGRIENATTLIVGTMVILAFSRSGDAVSVDCWLKRSSRNSWYHEMGAYRWPISFIRVYTTWAYFTAGVAKVRVSGWEWALSDNLSLVFKNTGSFLGQLLGGFPIVCQFLAIGVLMFELLSPLALFSTGFRRLWLTFLVVFHVGVALIFKNEWAFICFLFPIVFWFDWERHLT